MWSATPSKTLGVHERFGITVVGIKSPGKEFEYGSKELIMHRNDELIIMGKQNQIAPVPTQLTRSFHMGKNPEFHNHDFRFFFYLSYLP